MAKVVIWRKADKQNGGGVVCFESWEIMYLLTWSYGGIELDKLVDESALNSTIDELLMQVSIVMVEAVLVKADKQTGEKNGYKFG
jgi:hypothetical protein